MSHSITGIDLTERAVEYVRERLTLFNLSSSLSVGDAENLSFNDNSFDCVYTWGVLHHSPNTQQCINEVYRVLKPGGDAKIMIYHKYSMVGYMLWIKYALLRLKPFMSLNQIYSTYLESPGTKAFTIREAKDMLKLFKSVSITIKQSHADLLTSNAGQRHQGIALKLAKLFWPRWFIKTFFSSHGLTMMITAVK